MKSQTSETELETEAPVPFSLVEKGKQRAYKNKTKSLCTSVDMLKMRGFIPKIFQTSKRNLISLSISYLVFSIA